MSESKNFNVFWIDENVYNGENTNYYTILNNAIRNKSYDKEILFKRFTSISDFFQFIPNIKFIETIIIISGSLYYNFVSNFVQNIKSIFILPKIIIFTRDEKKFLQNPLVNIIHNKFYGFGGVKTLYKDIEEFVLRQLESGNILNAIEEDIKSTASKYENIYIFDYVEQKEQLLLPLFYKTLIDSTEECNNLIFLSFLEKYNTLKYLLKQIPRIEDIPKELLSKYYARIYTYNTNFYRNMNSELKNNNNDIYLPYIKTLYRGVEMESLPLASNNYILYRGAYIENKEIGKLIEYKQKKDNKYLAAIVFSKVFLSFSKDMKIALEFIRDKSYPGKSKVSKVLFILQKDNSINSSLSTHADIEYISYFPHEKEVLFFPFSSFEIKSIQKDQNNPEIYQINLFYLGKYLKEFQKDENFTSMEKKIPDSKFKKHLLKSNIVKKEYIKNINNKQIFQNYETYEKEIILEKEHKIENIINEKQIAKEKILKKENIFKKPEPVKGVEDNSCVNFNITSDPIATQIDDENHKKEEEERKKKCKILMIILLICVGIGIALFLSLFFILKKKK